jgi:hypothetical protein
VIAVLAEFLEQHVQRLGFGNEHGRAQHLAHIELFLSRIVAQQVLREQDADDVILVAAGDGKA